MFISSLEILLTKNKNIVSLWNFNVLKNLPWDPKPLYLLQIYTFRIIYFLYSWLFVYDLIILSTPNRYILLSTKLIFVSTLKAGSGKNSFISMLHHQKLFHHKLLEHCISFYFTNAHMFRARRTSCQCQPGNAAEEVDA